MMRRHPSHLRLKPLAKQVIVITGATSGIGLSTARAAAARGAALVLAARNEDALKAVAEDLSSKGAEVAFVAADVGREADVRAIAAVAVSRFGGFDTWVNNAGVTIVGPAEQTSLDDQRRLFDTNYWGVVYGSLAAIDQFQNQAGGGALINVGAGDVALPLQAAFFASKHAVKGFTDALRTELMAAHAPVSVTLIKPSGADTPGKDNARNLTGAPIAHPAGIYATPLVAQAILYAAEHRTRELTVGSGGRLLALASQVAPALTDPLLAIGARLNARIAKAPDPARIDNLHHAGRDLRERSFQPGVRETSLYATAQMKPKTTLGLMAAAALAAGFAFKLGARKAAPIDE
ncbi:SDR family oxidoreductase [Phenylobacterium montanum]|uniref:SDR family NAD(P)-dependent oxidoreductase n=1 Tax=Phenylobacterium montanum TaxID=2823693 RepID=A0A975FY49_9CAUL|nr:SDR family oxidoreductase [Caulobacter sp. S6]QUD87613.1 SDR family NAD(P)-dependent oxidoreductase [Caulobacter sp. S6]